MHRFKERHNDKFRRLIRERQIKQISFRVQRRDRQVRTSAIQRARRAYVSRMATKNTRLPGDD